MTVHTVFVRDVPYLRAEDVAKYLREVAATEGTDTRRRLLDAAQKLANPKAFDNLRDLSEIQEDS